MTQTNDVFTVMREAAASHPGEIKKPFDAIMNLSGYDAICAFCDMFGGSSVYIPTKTNVFRKCMEHVALDEYDGNPKKTASKYGFSESQVRKILRRKKLKPREIA